MLKTLPRNSLAVMRGSLGEGFEPVGVSKSRQHFWNHGILSKALRHESVHRRTNHSQEWTSECLMPRDQASVW